MRPGSRILRDGLITAAALAAFGCDRRSDAARYTDALAETADFEAAAADCRGISTEETRDDCLLAVLEQHGRLSEADCGGIKDQKWYGECLFQLAERQAGAGDLALALSTCDRSSFGRACVWHLLQDEVQASMADRPLVAEARIAEFRGARLIPDAPFQFWLTRFRETGGAGATIDEADCDELRDADPCRKAIEDHVRRSLELQWRANRASVCNAPEGQRAMSHGKPAWSMDGHIAKDAERRWASERCK